MDHAAALHPADETLLNYGLGKLDDTVAHTVNVHLEQCRPCRQRVSELSGDNFVQRLQQAQAAAPAAGAPGSKPGETVAQTLVEAGGPTPSRAETSIGPRREVVSDPGPGSPPRTPPAFREPVPPELLEQSQYKIVRELGRGGMGVVYLAHNKMMGRPEVLKVMSREVAAIPGTVDRFLREIRSAARLQHPNVVTAYAAQKMGDLLVLSMEYVEGEDLARLVRTRGPLPLINALYYICQAAQGLQHAHEKGMVHRDIKPGNMILFREGKKATVKILDFGLAKVSSERKVDTTLTGHGQMLGTPDYVAPEQMLDAVHADIRADIYSLGCTLYYLLAGEAPFSGSSLFDLLQKHQSEEAKPLNQIRRDVTPELAAVVARMMAKLPQQRYQTPSEVVQALKPFLKSGGTAKAPAELPPQDFATRPPESEPGVGNTLIEEAPVLLPLAPASPDERWKSLLDFSAVDSSTNRLSAIRDRRTAWPRWTWFAAGAGLLMAVFAVALALGVFRVKTANGVIVLEGLPGDAEVLVDGDKVTVTVPQTGQLAEITVVPGTHEIKVRKGDVTVFGERVSIASGGREQIRVQLQADPPVGTQVATTASAKPDVPADTVPMPDATPPPEPIPVTLNAASIPSDARAFGGHAYKFFPERLSWHAAQASCAAMGGHLIVIDSIYENEFAARLVGDAGALETWIGATDESTEGDWRTVDGRPLSYMNWFETQPNNMSAGENYALLSNRGVRDAPIGWKWFDESDESDQFQPGYICEWNTLPLHAAIPPDAQAFDGRYYKVYRETTSWENAAVRCTQMQGRLVVIKSVKENDFVAGIVKDAGIARAWIGLSDKLKEGEWQWMGGEPVTYSKWHRWPDGKSEPNDWRGEDYASISAEEDGEWHDVPNDDSKIHGFVCQWDAPPTPPSIPSDARTFGGHSYKFFPEQLSWHAAKAKCAAMGGHLIVIDDAEENAFAATLVADAQCVDTWIGATDQEEEGNWRTVFGDPLPFQNWCTRPKQPNNKPPGEHFAVMSGQVFGNGSSKWQWHDQQDAAESVLHPGYLCEWDAPPTGDPQSAQTGATGAPAGEPVGYVPLFNGKNLDGWKTHPSQPGRWRIKDGNLTGSGSAMSHLYTERNDFTDFHLRVVARINSGGNSGVYFRSGFGPEQTDGGGVAKWPAGYEAQINSTIDGPKTGSLYMPRSAVAIPTTTVKPGEWFTMYVLVEKQHILITVNGTKTAEYRGDDQFTKGHIALQAYAQTVVEFRTIEIKELGTPVAENAAGAPATLPAEEPDGFVPLFNGKNLDGWKTHPSQPGKWRVENGVLSGSGPDISHLYTKRSNLTDFHLRVEARINEGGNSGVCFRTGFGPDIRTREGTPRYLGGYEAQINSTHKDPNRTGSLFVAPGGVKAPVLNTAIKPGEWFTMEVLVQKQHIVITVNGEQTAEYDDTTYTAGHIALQQHNAETVVEFRAIEIKEL